MDIIRPKLQKAKLAFRQVYDDIGKSVPAVGKLIGGKVNYNINNLTPAQGQFQNACAIRMSYVLNQSGIKYPTFRVKRFQEKEVIGIYIK